MKTQAPRPGLKQRLFPRSPFKGLVEFRNGPDGLKKAAYRNVGRGGICLESSEMLKPGSRILLDFGQWLDTAAETECMARVVWAEATAQGCIAGVRIYHDEPSVGETLSALLQQAAAKSPRWETMTPYAMTFRRVETAVSA